MKGVPRLVVTACALAQGVVVTAAEPASKPGKARPDAEKEAVARGQQVLLETPRQSIEGTMYVPPKAGKIELPVYPYDLLRQRITGEASVSCMINTEGMVINTRVMKATRPEFGAALVAALEATRFGHATKEGEPIASVLGFRHTFNPKDHAEKDWQPEIELLERAVRRPQTLGKARDLDRPLRPREQRSPAFPPSLLSRGVGGEALIEFLLDETGRARLPRIVSATDPSFGYAAVHAVAQWRFEPPTARGEPTVMRVAIPFTFRVD
ncbi:MAG TPA: TonB family protein [Opitutaceae bacterium]|nr:TonB family protein [Opitutaceae bacterium]